MNFLINAGPGIGDIIQKLPMARALKENFPDSNIDLVMKGTGSSWKLNNQILECQDYVRNLYWYNVEDKMHCLKVLFQLRKNHYDFGFVRDGGMRVVSSVPSYWIFRIMRWGGCKKIVGFIKERVDILAEVPERAHFMERDLLTLKTIIPGLKELKAETVDASKTDFSFINSFDDLKNSDRIIALSVGTNVYPWTFQAGDTIPSSIESNIYPWTFENGKTIIYDVKSWAYEKWIELAKRLSEKNFSLILMGGEREEKAFKEKNIKIPDDKNIFNFIGKTSLKQSLAILSKCSLVVGSEGGMVHCASALGVKTLTIFGGSDYKIWRPANGEIIKLDLDCYPCFSTQRAAVCQYHRCLEEISVEMVLEKIKNILII